MSPAPWTGLLALALVAAECAAIGWLSGARWPGGAPWGPRWALRVLVGLLLLGLALLLVALAGASLLLVPLPLAVAAGLALAVRRVARVSGPGRAAHVELRRPADLRESVGWGLLAALLVAAGVRAWLVPEAGWDAYSHWGLKAKAYYLFGAIVDTRTAHEYYPPLAPLLEAWLYVHLGTESIDLAKVLWAVVGAAFAVCFTWHLRLAIRPAWVAPLAGSGIVLASTELLETFWTGQADLALAAGLCLSTLALFQWQQSCGVDRRVWLAQAALFGALAALSKYEGLFRLAVVVAALLLEGLLLRASWRAAARATLVVAAAAVLAAAPWAVFRSLHGIVVGGEHLGPPQWGELGAVVRALGERLAGVRTGGGWAVGLLGLAVGGPAALRPPLRLLCVVVVGQNVASFLAFLVTQSSPERQVYLAATRLLMQFAPLALFAAAVALATALGEPARAPVPAAGPLAEARREPEVASV